MQDDVEGGHAGFAERGAVELHASRLGDLGPVEKAVDENLAVHHASVEEHGDHVFRGGGPFECPCHILGQAFVFGLLLEDGDLEREEHVGTPQ
eukprot:3933276-Rhodomonas_salina.3